MREISRYFFVSFPGTLADVTLHSQSSFNPSGMSYLASVEFPSRASSKCMPPANSVAEQLVACGVARRCVDDLARQLKDVLGDVATEVDDDDSDGENRVLPMPRESVCL